MKPLFLTGEDLTLRSFYEVVLDKRPVRVSPIATRRMAAAYRVVKRVAARADPVYGVTTGFGKLADQRISPSDIEQLQLNLVRSHAAGVGEPLTREETRGVLLLRANVLARGHSGVSFTASLSVHTTTSACAAARTMRATSVSVKRW